MKLVKLRYAILGVLLTLSIIITAVLVSGGKNIKINAETAKMEASADTGAQIHVEVLAEAEKEVPPEATKPTEIPDSMTKATIKPTVKPTIKPTIKPAVKPKESNADTGTKTGEENESREQNQENLYDDLDLLARLIYAESKDESGEEHYLLAGNVVMNRMQRPGWPDTIRGVIYQKGQYSPTWNGQIKHKPNQLAVDCARRLLEGERFCPENVVYQAEFKQGKGIYKKIGKTYFCYE